MNPRLYIGNLSPEVGENELQSLFSRAGTVSRVELMRDPTTRQSRGFGFVTMGTPEAAAAALEAFHGYNLGGRHITVTEARPPQEPKGTMSEGFGLDNSAQFRPASGGARPGRRPQRSSRRRPRGR